MSTYNKKLSQYYDYIYSNKKYKDEVLFILKHSLNKEGLIDIGCGTLNHSILLKDDYKIILGLDKSKHMLDIAKTKIKNISNINVTSRNLHEIENKFTTAISMFNVINHIHSVHDLNNFFKDVNNVLETNGVFIFDCWNGIACTIDPPKEHETRTVNVDDIIINSNYYSKTDIFNSMCNMDINTDIYKNNVNIDSISYSLKQTLWTPKIIEDLLLTNNFYDIKVYSYFTDKIATEKDYKITFVVKK